MAEAGSHHLGAGVRAQASRQQPGLWGRGELQDQGQGPLGTAGATPEEAFYAYNGSWEIFRTDQSREFPVIHRQDLNLSQSSTPKLKVL